ncbi:MAG: L-rhamnose mutarotase [Cytophagales bacterium]|nr:L-rhamnose mutarotase [Cytophagales bacterium]
MKRFCLALDLKPVAELIAEYETHHKKIWPEIEASIKSAGIISMQIYRTGNRLFMVMETTDNFSFDAKSKSDAANPIVEQWEELMWKYQQALPGSQPGEKWKLMDKIFEL